LIKKDKIAFVTLLTVCLPHIQTHFAKPKRPDDSPRNPRNFLKNQRKMSAPSNKTQQVQSEVDEVVGIMQSKCLVDWSDCAVPSDGALVPYKTL
jgi:hypothetical protein